MKLSQALDHYLHACQHHKQLSFHTLKAYRIDLCQFAQFVPRSRLGEISKIDLEAYVEHLHHSYQPKTARRKLASTKAFFHYLEREDHIAQNPFTKMTTTFRQPRTLPRTIDLKTVQTLLESVQNTAAACPENRLALRNRAILELLFATGMRVGELCALRTEHLNLEQGTVLIQGKGKRERIIGLPHPEVRAGLVAWRQKLPVGSPWFFTSQRNNQLSEQSVRHLLSSMARQLGLSQHITPHMLRHTFATLLLEADVDIRYIQHLLGHSSLATTQIYTHVSTAKQTEILATKHPRNTFSLR